MQIADWERSYKPQWKDMSVSYWARHSNNDNEHMVKKLAGKRMNDVVDEEDLQLAMRTLKSRRQVENVWINILATEVLKVTPTLIQRQLKDPSFGLL